MDDSIHYEFQAPSRIVFGWGRRSEVGTLARTLGRRAFVVVGAAALNEDGTIDELAERLAEAGVATALTRTIEREPLVEDVDRLSEAVRGCLRPGDLFLAVGGGAAIDLAKAVAAMATQRESLTVKDYLENVGRDLKLREDPLPVMAMPTTAGTGAEATRNAVISSYDPPFKKSLRSEKILPRIALVDPELGVGVPEAVTAASGMDAITQLIESFLSRKAQPIPRALALEGLRGALPALVEAVENPSSRPARQRMAQAALLSGMALANSGLGMAHGVAAALGVHCRVAHGVACAVMLPAALRVNRHVCEADLARLAHLLVGKGPSTSAGEAVDALLAEIESVCRRVGIPRRLSELGVAPSQIPELVRSSRGSSMSGNPRELSDAELTEVLEGML